MGRKKRMRQKGRERRRETRNKRTKEERKGDFPFDFKENEQKQMFIEIWWIVLGNVAGLIPPTPERDGFAFPPVPIQYTDYNKGSISKPTFF